MTDPRHICAVIPTFNNGGTVADVVRGVLLQGLPVLVVDDGSTDDTAEKLKGLDITVVCHPKNRGKGRALRTGFEEARRLGYRFALTLDADGQHDPADIPALVAAAGERTLVVGSRNLTAEGMPAGNTFGNTQTRSPARKTASSASGLWRKLSPTSGPSAPWTKTPVKKKRRTNAEILSTSS